MPDNNWGNDFIQSYLAGVQQRLAREQQAFNQNKVTEMLPLEKEHLKAQIESANQTAEAMKAQLGAHAEDFKARLRAEFGSGLRTASGALQNPAMPGQQNVQPNVGDGLNNNPSVDPQLISLLQQNGAIPGNPTNAEIPQNFSPDQVPTQAPQITQDPNYRGYSRPNSTQFVNVDPRLAPGGLMQVDNVPTETETDQRTFKDKMLALTMAAKGKGLEKAAEAPYVEEINAKKAQATGIETRKTEVVRGSTQRDIENQKEKAAQDLAKINNQANMDRTIATNGGRVVVAKIGSAATAYTADQHLAGVKYTTDNKQSGTNISPEDLTNGVTSIANGTSKLPPLNMPAGRAYNTALKNSGLVAFDPIKRDKLVAGRDMESIINFMQQSISKAPEGILGAWRSAIASKIKATDTNEIYNQEFGRGANASHAIGGEIGRLSDPDIDRAMRIIGTTGTTKAQAIARLEAIKSERRTKIDGFLVGQKDAQKIMNLEMAGYDPTEIYGTVNVNGHSFKKYIQENGNWFVVDPKDTSANPYVRVK